MDKKEDSLQSQIDIFVTQILRTFAKSEPTSWFTIIERAKEWAKAIEEGLEISEVNENYKLFQQKSGGIVLLCEEYPDTDGQKKKWYFYGKPLSWNSFYCSHHLLCRTILYNSFITSTWIMEAAKIYLGIDPNDTDGINALAKDIQKRVCPQTTTIILNSLILSVHNAVSSHLIKLPLRCSVNLDACDVTQAFFTLCKEAPLDMSFHFAQDWITKKAFAKMIKTNLLRSSPSVWEQIISQLCDPVTLNEINAVEMVYSIPVVQVLGNAMEQELDSLVVQSLLKLDINYLRFNPGILCELSYRSDTFFQHYAGNLLKGILSETKPFDKSLLQNKLPPFETIVQTSLVCPLVRSLVVLASRSLQQKQYILEMLQDLLLNIDLQLYSGKVLLGLIHFLDQSCQ